MENTTKLLINHTFSHLMLIPAFMYGEWWMFLAAFAWWYVIAIIAISGGYHRYYSHKSFSAGRWYDYAVNVLGIFSGAGPAMTWAGTHRQHHAYSDTEDDPHSYTRKGWFAVYVNTWGYDFKIKRRFIKRLLSDKLLRWFYTNYFTSDIAFDNPSHETKCIFIDPTLRLAFAMIGILFPSSVIQTVKSSSLLNTRPS